MIFWCKRESIQIVYEHSCSNIVLKNCLEIKSKYMNYRYIKTILVSKTCYYKARLYEAELRKE